MYNEEKIVINSINLTVEEIYEYYRRGKIVFYQNSNIGYTKKNKIVKEVLDALSRGIPFPPVYASELQTGQLLVLNKSNRLSLLMEFIDGGFAFRNEVEYRELSNKYERYYNQREIFYSQISLYVIDYINPRYMHMQLGFFTENWTPTQEQSIRRILYKELENSAFRELFLDMKIARNVTMSLEYLFLHFIMVHLCVIGVFEEDIYISYKDVDRFELLEKTICEISRMKVEYLLGLRDQFMECYSSINSTRKENAYAHFLAEYKTNYICFLGAFRLIVGRSDLEMLYNRDIRQMIQNCDMSYGGIKQILEYFKRGIL